MNYKITTIILAVVLVIVYVSKPGNFFSFYNNRIMTESNMGGMQDMHRMSDGSMMHNSQKMNMGNMMMDMTVNMKGKKGKELEKAFIAEMIPHHQGAVDMAKLLLEDTTIRPELVKFANDIITAQEGEIKQMQEWLKSY